MQVKVHVNMQGFLQYVVVLYVCTFLCILFLSCFFISCRVFDLWAVLWVWLQNATAARVCS